MTSEPTNRPFKEIVLVYGLSVGATIAILQLTTLEPLRDVGLTALALLYLVIAVRSAQREPGGIRRYGIHLAGLLEPPAASDGPAGPLGILDLARALRRAALPGTRELGFALLVALVTFPPFIVGFFFWNTPEQAFSFGLPAAPLSFILAQLLIVALPEEALFRGYFQTRLSDAWPASRNLLGAPIHITALITQAALFALIHFVVDPNPGRLAVFFPGLIFGWMRARRGGIGAAVAYHALCNLLSDILYRGWF